MRSLEQQQRNDGEGRRTRGCPAEGLLPSEVRDEIRGEREGETRSLLSSGMRSEARDRERHGACCRRA
ncbi:hypothetical protein AAC387_Pa02g2771 [Persea americana]